MKFLGSLFVIFVITPLSTVWNGYVLSVLWRWFMVPTFKLPPLSIPVAIGVALVVAYLTHQFDEYESPDSSNAKLTKRIALAILKPALALLFGEIVLQFC